MAETLFTCPGKIGDDFFRLPVACRYAREQRQPVDLALDEGSRCMVSLLQQQDWIDRCFVWPGITSYANGGQPWDFGNPPEFAAPGQNWGQVYHLGYRQTPGPNLTQAVHEQSGVPLEHPEWLRNECCIHWTPQPIDTLVIHLDAAEEGHLQAATHARNKHLDATLWPVWSRLIDLFAAVLFVGLHRYPERYARYIEAGQGKVCLLHDDGHLEIVVAWLERGILLTSYSSMWALGNCMQLDQVVLMDESYFHPARLGGHDRLIYPFDSDTLLQHVVTILGFGPLRNAPPAQFARGLHAEQLAWMGKQKGRRRP